jgi:hypothetical protein
VISQEQPVSDTAALRSKTMLQARSPVFPAGRRRWTSLPLRIPLLR